MRGDTVFVNVSSPERRAARSWGGKDSTRCARVCKGGAAYSGKNGSVAMLTLVCSTLTVEVLPVVNEGIREMERFSARSRLAFSNGMRFGRPSRRRSDLALAVYARYGLTVQDLANFTGWHA